jgi:hypothetical protein
LRSERRYGLLSHRSGTIGVGDAAVVPRECV